MWWAIDCDSLFMTIFLCHSNHLQVLFRKTNNRCSEYIPGEQLLTPKGTKIYERFIATGGTDIKVYTVTGLYAHAEGRKAPVVDGKVRASTICACCMICFINIVFFSLGFFVRCVVTWHTYRDFYGHVLSDSAVTET